MLPTVAIIGRPNVGKSTLFNRLTGKHYAIVDDIPGVTRDRRTDSAKIGNLTFHLIDTAGLENSPKGSLQGRMRRQTEHAIKNADITLFMIDARVGLMPDDIYFAKWLRSLDTIIILIANKCESSAAEGGRIEAYALGLGEPIAISAEHGIGMAKMFDALQPYFEAFEITTNHQNNSTRIKFKAN